MFNEVQSIRDLEELASFSKKIASKIQEENFYNLILYLEGEMGAGKTTFTSQLAKALGIKSRVTSPTFVGMNHYSSDIDLYHFDCYQVGVSEAETLEILDSDKKKILIFEWSENIDTEFKKILNSKSKVYKISISHPEGEQHSHPEGEQHSHPEGEARRISISEITN